MTRSIHYIYYPSSQKTDLRLVFLHGWGQSHKAFESFYPLCNEQADVMAVDFPGFGQSEPPTEAWDTHDYAMALHDLLQDKDADKLTVLIGHSFGCRVALRLSNHHPEQYQNLIFIAPAGLQRRRSLLEHTLRWIRSRVYKAIKLIDRIAGSDFKARWAKKYGSQDYNAAQGVMRDVLVKIVTEDLTEVARNVKARVLLLCGERDKQTPPEFARRYKELIPNSECHILKGFDHYTILNRGRHQLHNLMEQFLRTVKT